MGVIFKGTFGETRLQKEANQIVVCGHSVYYPSPENMNMQNKRPTTRTPTMKDKRQFLDNSFPRLDPPHLHANGEHRLSSDRGSGEHRLG